MEENKVVDVGEPKKNILNNSKSIKPFLSVFIILVLLISGYYFIWRSITIKMKNIVADSVKNFKYDTITVSGFPFSKKVKIQNITFANNVFLITKNKVNVKEIVISSFIFGSNMSVKFNDITTVNINDNNAVYSLNYNEQPEINLSFYSNGNLKSFEYSDAGYRVVSPDNKTLYTADKSNVDVKSIMNGDTTDYSIEGEFQKMQNISIIDNKGEVPLQSVPEVYNMKFDISSSLTKTDGEVKKSVVKINNFELTNDKNNNVQLTGQIFKEPGDLYSFGDLKFVVTNYDTILSDYKTKVLEALKIENSSLPVKEQNEYIEIANKTFSIMDTTIKKNSETKNNIGVITLSRKKGVPDYVINGESLFGIIQQIIQ